MKKICIKNINHKFSDGLEFIPDINRIHSLAEVFTPYPVVWKMITDVGITRDKSNATVFEPASGHGNFGIEILRAKLDKVIKEMNYDGVTSNLWTKEYEIRSLLALASLYQNDIDQQNIDELKSRLHNYMLIRYKKNSKNSKLEVPTYYDIAITNILSLNCIKKDFLSKNKGSIPFIFCFRDGDYIYRIKKRLKDILQINEISNSILFDSQLQFDTADYILYKDWKQDIDWNNYLILKGSKMKVKKNSSIEKENNVYNKIKSDLLEKFNIKDKDFKFTYCISNPPYQILDGGGHGDSAIPVYNIFYKISKDIANNVSVIMPSKWMAAGKGLVDFRHELINDHHIYKLYDFYNSQEIFPTAHIDGGVCIVVWKNNYNGKAKIVTKLFNGKIIESNRYLKIPGVNVYIRDYRLINIVEKIIKSKNFNPFSKIVSSRNNYGIYTDFFNKTEKYSNVERSKTYKSGWIKLYGVIGKKGGAKRTECYISPLTEIKNKNELNLYKLFISKAFTFGEKNDNIPKIILAEPNSICTETFLRIGPFSSKKHAENCLSYIKTKFFRILLSILKISMNLSKECFEIIPLLNFDESVTDEKLYSLFNLSKEEVEYINNTVGTIKVSREESKEGKIINK